MTGQTWQQGLKAALPTMLGYLSVGIAYGIVAGESGLAPWQIFLTSLLIYSGSGQFVMCALLLARANLVTISLTVFLTNLRYFLLGMHTATIFSKVNLAKQLLLGSFLSDESYGVLLVQHLKDGTPSFAWMLGNNMFSYLAWIVASTLGGLLGDLLPDPALLGIDFALIAMFIAIFSGQLEAMVERYSLKKVGLILGTVVVTFGLASFVFSGSLATIAATIVACFVGVMTDD